jgi:hypothetical protein
MSGAMGNPALQIVRSIQRMVCTGCGAEANASCNCGKPYVPKSVRAREAIEANPEKSDRAIAADIGVSQPTVSKIRKELEATDNNLSVEERIGLDGKKRKMPEKKPEADVDPEPIGFTTLDYNGLSKEYEKLQRAHEKLLRKQPLLKDDDKSVVNLNDYLHLLERNRKLEARNNVLLVAFNAKEAQASRNWPADMTPRQVKQA